MRVGIYGGADGGGGGDDGYGWENIYVTRIAKFFSLSFFLFFGGGGGLGWVGLGWV